MFTPINIVIGKKIKKPDFKIFSVQKNCSDYENLIKEEFKIKNIKVINIDKKIIKISCKNKVLANEIQIKKRDIIEKIKKNKKVDIVDIKII